MRRSQRICGGWGMGDSWETMTVEQISDPRPRSIAIGPFGSRMKADRYVSVGVPVIRGLNISDTRTFRGEFVYVSDGTADELAACNVFADDLVFPHRGAIGLVGIVPSDANNRYMLSTSLMKLTCDTSKVDPRFLYYFFRSSGGRNALLAHVSTVGTPGIGQPLASLRGVRVPVPPLDEQRKVSAILGTLDDKIELNRRMSETLEAMARALFKSWFVDFDPVRAKAEGRDTGLPKEVADLFPDSFEDSELGEIPKGWGVGPFGAAVEEVRERENPAAFPGTSYRLFSIPAFDDERRAATELGENIKSQKSRVPPGAILLSKLNPEIERVWKADVVPGDRAVCSTEFLVLQPRSGHESAYTYCLACSPKFRQGLQGLATGTSNSHQRARADEILGLHVVEPSLALVVLFSRMAESLLQRAVGCGHDSRDLAALRDMLIPRLITGELRVTERVPAANS